MKTHQRLRTVKLLEENLGETLEAIGRWKDFLNRTSTAQEIVPKSTNGKIFAQQSKLSTE